MWDFYESQQEKVGGVLVACRVPDGGSEYTEQVDLLTPMPWAMCRKWEGTRIGRRGGDYEAMKAHFADECIALAARQIPELAEAEKIYTSTPLTWKDYTSTPQGSAYGVRKDCQNALTTMLSPRTPVPNLLLTGQSVMLHGIHGVTMTAFNTCAEILGKEKIFDIINN